MCELLAMNERVIELRLDKAVIDIPHVYKIIFLRTSQAVVFSYSDSPLQKLDLRAFSMDEKSDAEVHGYKRCRSSWLGIISIGVITPNDHVEIASIIQALSCCQDFAIAIQFYSMAQVADTPARCIMVPYYTVREKGGIRRSNGIEAPNNHIEIAITIYALSSHQNFSTGIKNK